MSVTQAMASAPASVGNVAVGFDLLGHSLEGPCDRAIVRRVSDLGVHIRAIRGVVTDLPRSAKDNTAGAALLALQHALALPFGFELELEKGIPVGSGMGGSAASAVAALIAANALLESPLTREELYPFALQGEAVASGSYHGDNVGPALWGGLVLATAKRVVPIKVTVPLYCLLVHPHAVLETRRARQALQGAYALESFVEQSTHLALVILGCEHGDLGMIKEGLNDVLIEPRRAALITGFYAAKQAALDQEGVLGASISGAGPSVFAWYENRSFAEAALPKVRAGFLDAGLASDAWISPVKGPRAEVLACTA